MSYRNDVGYITHKNSVEKWSQQIFHILDRRAMSEPRAVTKFEDRFETFGTSGNPWTIVEADSGATAGRSATEENTLELVTGATDNNEAYVDLGEAGIVEVDENDGEIMGFEARVKVSSVADNANGIFVGLAEEGSAAANFLVDDTAEPADKDYVGFLVLQADGDQLQAVHRTGGGSKVTAGADVKQLTADTYVNLGMHHDGVNTYRWYVDGVEVASTTLDAANFPNGEEMGPILAVKTGSATSITLSCRGVKVMQDHEIDHDDASITNAR